MRNGKQRLRQEKKSRRLEALRENAKKLPCGTRSRYLAGCRCELCASANRLYLRAYRLEIAKRGKVLMPVEKVLKHIAKLRRQGFGLGWIAEQAGLDRSTLRQIVTIRKHIKRETAQRILGIDGSRMRGKHKVKAAKTYAMLDELLNSGFSKIQIQRLSKSQLPYRPRGKHITAKTAAKIATVYQRFLMDI